MLVTFTCYYSEDGVVIPGTLISNSPYQVVIPDGEESANIAVEISDSAFLSIGASFESMIDEVKLLNGKLVLTDEICHGLYCQRAFHYFIFHRLIWTRICVMCAIQISHCHYVSFVDLTPPSFNSPYKGERRTEVAIVTSDDANGEIGFSDDYDLIVSEPDNGNITVSVSYRADHNQEFSALWAINF